MTSFTTEDRLNAEKEGVPFAGWIYSSDEIVEMLREQLHAQNSEIIRLNERVRQLESQLYGGNTK
jgi:hypothetical protein